MSQEGPSCQTCGFWNPPWPIADNRPDVVRWWRGECRRHAPADSGKLRYQTTGTLPKWPDVEAQDWCGDYEERVLHKGE